MTCNRRFQAYAYEAPIAEGAYGAVWRCRDPDGKLVACKLFKEAHEHNVFMRLAVREVRMLEAVDHPNLVKVRLGWRGG